MPPWLRLTAMGCRGGIVEDAVLALIDAVMSIAVEILQTGNKFSRVNIKNTGR